MIQPKPKPFVCPECGSRLVVMFQEYWKCHNQHRTPRELPKTQVEFVRDNDRLPYKD